MEDHYVANMKVLEEVANELFKQINCNHCRKVIRDVFRETENRLTIDSILKGDYRLYKEQQKEKQLKNLKEFRSKQRERMYEEGDFDLDMNYDFDDLSDEGMNDVDC
jgi:hypothetical protein